MAVAFIYRLTVAKVLQVSFLIHIQRVKVNAALICQALPDCDAAIIKVTPVIEWDPATLTLKVAISFFKQFPARRVMVTSQVDDQVGGRGGANIMVERSFILYRDHRISRAGFNTQVGCHLCG